MNEKAFTYQILLSMMMFHLNIYGHILEIGYGALKIALKEDLGIIVLGETEIN